MLPRLVTKSIHAYLDYPVAIGLMAMPFLLGLGQSHPMALWLSLVTGAAAFVMTLFTDHHLGVVRVLPYRLHLTVDLAVGVLFLVAPFLFGFGGLDTIYYWANGAAVLIVVNLHKPEETLQLA
ncbi:MAG: SPW repeat domain-containing protein [Geminicoccaceae bacterium]